ncbi:cyclic pyranopterin monophosphate synthase MoaC [Neorhodopirellula lusitana]|uniref:cyclic pyranopterin monophosphate synthase MoaC n=1 Tax=Neorhodopirellula lusitana TaxID=445327 RepID=UPI00384C773D
MQRSTHFDESGQAQMVDVTAKSITPRTATATAVVSMNAQAAQSIRQGDSRKGDVLAVARLAAITGTKWTSTLIPLCHAIPIEGVEVGFQWLDEPAAPSTEGTTPTSLLRCTATVKTTYKTGVEMEAMTAASVAALTIYDMLKSVDRSMEIRQTRLEHKDGGKSGLFQR